jgi:hypothetical protein
MQPSSSVVQAVKECSTSMTTIVILMPAIVFYACTQEVLLRLWHARDADHLLRL